MLDLIRKKQRSFIIKIVFWTIIAAFVGTIFLVWGRGSDPSGAPSSVAVTVNGDKIAYESYQRAYSNLYNLYQNIYRERFTPEMERRMGLRQQALEMVIEQTLLVQEAKRRGVKITEAELVESIASVPAFQENGAFSRDRYLEVLRYQRMTPDAFEKSQRQQLLIDKTMGLIQGDTNISPEDVEEEFRRRNEEVELDYVALTPGLLEDQVKISEEEIASWFEKNHEQFRIPEKIALRYIEFQPARYREDVTFTEEELERYYRRHLTEFEIPEQVEASHILIKVPEGAEEAEVEKKRALAEKVREEVRSGEDFAELAREYSDDKGSAEQDGSLGYFVRGVMVPAFEEAAFGLEPGQVSEVVRTPFGFHVIKVTGRIEAGVEPLADVLDQVQEGLRREKARQLAIEKAMDAYNLNRKDGSIATAAEANDLDIKETGLFAQGEAIDGIGNLPELAETAFTLNQGELAKPAILDRGIYLFTVKERQPSRLPDLEDVRAKAEQALRSQKALDLAQKKAEEILADLKEGKKLSATAEDENLRVEKTGLFSRSFEAFIPRLGNNEALANAAFDLEKQGAPVPEVYQLGNRFVVAVLAQHKAADMDDLDTAKRKEISEELLRRRQDETLQEKLAELREQAGIIIDPVLANSLER